ncbi:hypothetical protein KAU13_05835, partial [candidate division WOR-3 bacterium]|nr:hypothetical protein [candidate division WOR-3 bacterium]
GYLLAMEKISVSHYEERDVVLAEGKQGNKLYLDYKTRLPMRYELKNKVVVFEEYKTINGLGKFPFLIVTRLNNEVVAITRITDVEKQVSIPRNFFSVPKQEIETLD